MRRTMTLRLIITILIAISCNINTLYGQHPISATFNNSSQNSTDRSVQADARAALIQVAVRRYPGTTDVVVNHIMRQNNDMWLVTGRTIGTPTRTSVAPRPTTQQATNQRVAATNSQVVLGAISATFNVTTRNRSQSSTDSDVQANARAALIQEATRRFPNATDVTITNVARQNSDTWMEGAFVVLSVNYIATGQAIGSATHVQPHTTTPQATRERLGTVQTRFVSRHHPNGIHQMSSAEESQRALQTQAAMELRMVANNRFEGNIVVENINFHLTRRIRLGRARPGALYYAYEFEYLAEGVVYRIR